MSIRRWNRIPKTRAQKGKPGTPMRHITVRIDADGKRREWHPTKGWRQLA